MRYDGVCTVEGGNKDAHGRLSELCGREVRERVRGEKDVNLGQLHVPIVKSTTQIHLAFINESDVNLI